jgi:magnesium-transporting ATPase (P-type)
MILVSSSSSGISYVETSSLDGEKNLKPKFSNSVLQKMFNAEQRLNMTDLSGRINCINPTAEIESF